MPIIFVHGVNNRVGAAYDTGIQVKTSFLRGCFSNARINGKTFGAIQSIAFPYWGGLAAKFAWNMASLPRDDMQALGVATDPDYRALLAHILDALPGGLTNEPLVALARMDFGNAVELISTMALDEAAIGDETNLAQLVVAMQKYAAANPRPPWIDTITTDQQLLARLIGSVQPPASVQEQGIGKIFDALSGVFNQLKAAAVGIAGTAVDRTGNFASSKLLGWAREPLNEVLGRFFGDIFIYFDQRGNQGNPGAIPRIILAAIDSAVAAAPPDEPLVIVGHSLGGVIVFDLLGHYRPKLKVDLFVSVGSQVAHFEELKLYHASDPAVLPPGHASTPPNIARWINVYDPVDIFSYAANRVFDRVDIDASYDTKTYVIKAHGAYFDQARFYERLRARIDALP